MNRLTDTQRLDFLQKLAGRTEFQNSRRPKESVSSDIHVSNGGFSVYIRNLFGNVVIGGSSNDIRAVIDELATHSKLIFEDKNDL